ncbi:hypothetical protein F4703DRAFT_1788858 [Phycomyces blakesleeanus]
MPPSCISTKKFKCYCAVYRIKVEGYNTMSAQTLKCHERDEQIAIRGQINRITLIINTFLQATVYSANQESNFQKMKKYFKETSEVVSHNEINFEDKKLNDSMKGIEMSAQIRDLSLSESDAVFDIKGNKYAASNDIDEEDESDDDISNYEATLTKTHKNYARYKADILEDI